MQTAKAREVDLPDEIRALDALANPSYTYACAITTPVTDARSAEQWARAVFEGAPRLLRWFMVTGWVAGLGLRLGPRPSPRHVLGWTILSATPATTVLGVESFALSARLVVDVRDARVVHATLVRYERRLARILWAAAAPLHGRIIPYLLRHAARASA